MIAVLSVGASACFMARFAFRILFVMASAFFCMLAHHDSPPRLLFEPKFPYRVR